MAGGNTCIEQHIFSPVCITALPVAPYIAINGCTHLISWYVRRYIQPKLCFTRLKVDSRTNIFSPGLFSMKILVQPDHFYNKICPAGPIFLPDQNFRESTSYWTVSIGLSKIYVYSSADMWEVSNHLALPLLTTVGRTLVYVTHSRKRGHFPQKFIRGYGC